MVFLHFWEHWLGLDNGSGDPYLFWSGFGADLTEFAIIGALFNMARRHNCHVRKCWRIGHIQVDGTPHVVCRKHHPDLPDKAPSADQVREDHRRAVNS